MTSVLIYFTPTVSTMRFLIEIMFIMKAIKSHFKGACIINRILHPLSFHTEFTKLARGSFHKLHMKGPLL